MGFDESDASGWDECLPSVAACSVEFAGEQAEIPDHGDLWRVEWEPVETKGEGRQTSSVSLAGKCFSLPLGLERTIFLAEIESGWRLSLAYRLTNLGSAPAPWSWAAHALFLAEAGDRIVLPETISTLRLEGSGGGRLGKNGDAVSWPLAKVASGGETDISVALPAGFRRWRQTFRRAAQRKGKLVRTCPPKTGVKIRVNFDPASTPYLGLWICYGGWPEKDGPKQTCIALEPSTAPVDSLAETGPWSRQLAPGKQFNWAMQVEIESL